MKRIIINSNRIIVIQNEKDNTPRIIIMENSRMIIIIKKKYCNLHTATLLFILDIKY